jgi:hypothetical protein
MDIAKIAWQARIASRHLDRRTIAVPESMKGKDKLRFDHWECSQIMANVLLDLLTSQDRAIVESLAKERPITWF